MPSSQPKGLPRWPRRDPKEASSGIVGATEPYQVDLARLGSERLRVLLEINNAIVTHLERDSLFQSLFDTIAESVRPALPFHRFNMTLYDPERDVFRAFALVGPEIAPGNEVPGSRGGQGRMLHYKRPFVTRDIRERPVNPESAHIRAAAIQAGLRSSIIVPLLSAGETIGTLIVSSKEVGQYTECDGDFLFAVGRQIALALRNMMAYEEIGRLKAKLERENLYLKEEVRGGAEGNGIVGRSSGIRKVLEAIARAAPTDVTVLIHGETGTGKELVAREIHRRSPRAERTLVRVSCAALPQTLIETELFGHERGAFTGAVSRKLGRFDVADGGTLLLDEVGDLPLDAQARLLRVLQEGEFDRVGGLDPVQVNVRIVAATNRSLADAVRAGRFREDLYYRLNVFPIEVPPLRERIEDIPALVAHFVDRYAKKFGRVFEPVAPRVLEALVAYAWPGNVRELENVVQRAVIISRGPDLTVDDVFPEPCGAIARGPGKSLVDVEREHILRTLEFAGWRVAGPRGAAALLGLKRSTLLSRMKRLGIRRPRVDSSAG